MLVTPILLGRIKSLVEAQEFLESINRKEIQFQAETILEVRSGFKSASGDVYTLRRSLMSDYKSLLDDHQKREMLKGPSPIRLTADDSIKTDLTSEELITAAKYFDTVARAIIYLGRYDQLPHFSLKEGFLLAYDYSVLASQLLKIAESKEES